MEKKVMEKFLEKEILSGDAVKEHYERSVAESKSAISAMARINVDEFMELEERIGKLSISEIEKMNFKEVDELLGEKVIAGIDKNLAHATVSKRKHFRKDFILLMKEYEKMNSKIDQEVEKLNEDNDEFKKNIDRAMADVMANKETLKESLQSVLEDENTSEIDKDNAKQMLAAVVDMENLKFLDNRNLRTLVKTINNNSELVRLKTKALKIINSNSFDEQLPFDFFEKALIKFVKSNEELSKADPVLLGKIITIITVRFYKFISKTKRLGVYEKASILYFKTYLMTACYDKDVKSLDNVKFKENLTNYFLYVLKENKILR